MLPKEFVDFATAHPLAYVATTDGDQPHVRILLLLRTDETGFYIVTLSPKSFVDQLEANAKVELCFYNNPADVADSNMMRAVGRITRVTDKDVLAEGRAAREFLKSIPGTKDRYKEEYVVVYRLGSGKAAFWNLTDVLREREMEWTEF